MTKVFAVAALQRYAIEFDDVLDLLICAISNINLIEGTTIFFASCTFGQIGTVSVLKLHMRWHVNIFSIYLLTIQGRWRNNIDLRRHNY